MGRGSYYRYDKKDLISDMLPLDLQKFAGSVALNVRSWGSWTWTRGDHKSSVSYIVEPGRGVKLQYTHNKTEALDYLVSVVTTKPHFGGVRYWWVCPNQACGRRCRILYGGKYFCCRQCHHLTYLTAQSGDLLASIDSRFARLCRKLHGNVDDFRHIPAKPSQMHWTTYGRLMAEYLSLLHLRNRTWLRGALAITGPFENSPPLEPLGSVQASWQTLKRLRQDPDDSHHAEALLPYTRDSEESAETKTGALRARLTLGQLADRAEVSYAFAQEAVAEGLLSADQGRTKRRKRYRRRLSAWLCKLYQLRQAGLSWADLRAWKGRRFKPGHEQERLWPAGSPLGPKNESAG